MTQRHGTEPRDLTRARRTGLALGVAAGGVGVAPPGLPAGVHLASAVVALLVVGALLGPRLAGVRVGPLDVAVLGYVVVRVGVELADAQRLGHPVAVTALADLVVGLAVLVPVRAVVHTRAQLVAMLRGLVAPSLVVSGIAVAQLLGVPGVNGLLRRWTASGGLADRLDRGWSVRATSLVGHWTALGGYLCVVVAVLLLLLAEEARRGRPPTRWLVAGLGLAVLATLATLTFAPIILVTALLVVAGLLARRRVATGLGLLAAVVVGSRLFGGLLAGRLDSQVGASATQRYPGLPQTVSFRLDVWVRETLPTVAEHPWLGWGADAYDPTGWAQRPLSLAWPSPESEWLRTAVSAGLVGLTAQLVLLAVVLGCVVAPLRRLERDAGTVLAVLVVGLLVLATFHSHLTNRGVPLVLWPLLAGIAGVLTTRGRTDRADPVPAPTGVTPRAHHR